MTNPEIRRRVERFASLQAAHRALAHSVHPAELETVRKQSRRLLIRLQSLSSEAEGPNLEPDLEEIDRALDEQSRRTLAVLSSIELPQLRATIPLLSAQYPDEVRGLVDLLLAGDLQSDKNLRILEYLITMLATDDLGERRAVARPAAEVTPRLREVTNERLETASADCLVAERVLEDATSKVVQEDELGDIRDRVRRYKEGLAGDLLHPRVLAAAVAYNVAMWNRVAVEIESSRSMGELTEGLMLPEASHVLPLDEPTQGRDVLSSSEFVAVVAALRDRILEQPAIDDAAGRIAAALEVHAVRVEDAEAFAADEADEAAWLMRASIVAGLMLSQRDQIEALAGEYGLDLDALASRGVEDLASQISELARKQFANSNYGEAFRLSDVKTHSLAAHLTARSAPGADDIAIPKVAPATRSGFEVRVVQMLRDLPPWPVLFAVILFVAVFTVPSIVGDRTAGIETRERLQQVSPFLEKGEILGSGEATFFVGRVGRTWDYLNTEDRRRVLTEVGQHFAERGTDRVVFENRRKEIVAEFENGMIRFLVNRSSAEGDRG